MNFTKFPRRNYHQGNSPIEFMPALTQILGGDVNLYVKQDDLPLRMPIWIHLNRNNLTPHEGDTELNDKFSGVRY